MTDGRTDGGDCNIPNAFLKNCGDKNSHMEASIHVGVIVVRTQFFVLIYEFILISPKNYIYYYNYPHIYWISMIYFILN